MPRDRSELQELKEFITEKFNEHGKRLDKLESGLKGDEYSPGIMQQRAELEKEFRRFKEQIDLSPEDVEIIKALASGARSWKMMLVTVGTLLGGLAGLLLWIGRMIKAYSPMIGN